MEGAEKEEEARRTPGEIGYTAEEDRFFARSGASERHAVVGGGPGFTAETGRKTRKRGEDLEGLVTPRKKIASSRARAAGILIGWGIGFTAETRRKRGGNNLLRPSPRFLYELRVSVVNPGIAPYSISKSTLRPTPRSAQSALRISSRYPPGFNSFTGTASATAITGLPLRMKFDMSTPPESNLISPV
jgi:hypothetical protein